MADKPNQPTTEPFAHCEMDRLLAQAASAETPTPAPVAAAVSVATTRKVAPHDFRNPVFLAETELRQLRILHEDFVRYLSARLSLYLRMEFGLKMAGLTTVPYSQFTESLPNQTHLSLFKVEPLVGVGILDINPRLALTIADRLLGGRGNSVKADRYLTEIEIALIEDVIMIVLEEWCGQWKSVQELSAHIIGHENNGRFLQTSPRDAVILALKLECSFGDCAEQIQIGVPFYTIEPVVRKIQARSQKDATVTQAVKRAEWQPSHDRIMVPVRAEWQAFELTLREIASLRVGDVVEMQPGMCSETRVLLNGTPKFVGTVGLDTDRVAVQLTSKLPSEKTTHA